MAKAPIPCRVKMDLCPLLGADAAAELYERFIADVIARAAALPDTELIVSYAPAESLPYFRAIAPTASAYMLRRQKSTAEGIASCIAKLAEPGRAIVMIGADAPTMPARSLELAFDVLATGEVDVVLGPAQGGGLYLFGVTASHPKLLEDVLWNGPSALNKIVENAANLGLGWYLLPEWYHVNTPHELQILQDDLLKGGNGGHSAECTGRYLRVLAENGVIQRSA
jgi:glycosyltransferase A (GT-A) superfamily protein (DUF2064 family)